MTEFIPPMLAKPALRPLTDTKFWSDYVAEPKHDGMRVIIVKGPNGEMTVYSRSGKVYTQHVPHLVDYLDHVMPKDSVLDGELAYVGEDSWCYSPEGIAVPLVNFNKTMRVMGSLSGRAVSLQQDDRPLTMILFDVLRWEGKDFTSLDYLSRREKMLDFFYMYESSHLFINPAFNFVNRYQSYFDNLTEFGVEGLIMKNTSAGYFPGKRANKVWFKFKSEKTFDVVVTGFTDANEGVTGKFLGQIGAIKFGAYNSKGELVEVGKCSGMDDATRKQWTEFKNAPAALLNQYVIEVKCNELVGSGEYRTPRHPQYVGIRQDKAPSECSMEQFK